MAHQGIPIVCGGLILLLGLTPCSSNAQTTANPPASERQGVADQPVGASSSENVQDPAAYDRQAAAAETHVRKAEIAGNEGNIPEMLRQTSLSLEQAKAAQRAGTNPDLNDGIMDLKETLRVGQRDQIAPSALQQARIKLSRAATIHNLSRAATIHNVTGDLLRIDGEFYVVKEPSGKEVRLHVDGTSKLEGTFQAGDKIEAQASEKGHALSIKPTGAASGMPR